MKHTQSGNRITDEVLRISDLLVFASKLNGERGEWGQEK